MVARHKSLWHRWRGLCRLILAIDQKTPSYQAKNTRWQPVNKRLEALLATPSTMYPEQDAPKSPTSHTPNVKSATRPWTNSTLIQVRGSSTGQLSGFQDVPHQHLQKHHSLELIQSQSPESVWSKPQDQSASLWTWGRYTTESTRLRGTEGVWQSASGDGRGG